MCFLVEGVVRGVPPGIAMDLPHSCRTTVVAKDFIRQYWDLHPQQSNQVHHSQGIDHTL